MIKVFADIFLTSAILMNR